MKIAREIRNDLPKISGKVLMRGNSNDPKINGKKSSCFYSCFRGEGTVMNLGSLTILGKLCTAVNGINMPLYRTRFFFHFAKQNKIVRIVVVS